MKGVSDINGIVTPMKATLETHENRIKEISDASATFEKKFLEWRKTGLRMSNDQRSKRGLGNAEMNENFGKAIVNLARKNGVCDKVFTKAALTDTNLVSVEYAAELIRLVEAQGVIRQISRSIPMGAGTVNWPRRTAGIIAAHTAAGSSISASNPTTGQVQLIADTILALSLVQNASLEDSVVDLGAYVAEEIAYGFATIEDADAINGDGTATYGGVEGLVNASLYLLTNKPTEVGMPATKTSFQDVNFDHLIDCIDAVKSSALDGARWLMHRSVLSILRKVKDDNKQYIWEPSPGLGQPATILGYPYTACDAMPAATASAAATRFLVFGNFNYWYFGDRRMMGITADASRYREYDQTGFFGTERVAQNIADGGAFAVLKTAAA